MSSQVRLIKKGKALESMHAAANATAKNEQQRNREIVGIVKSWIDEFKLGRASRSQTALLLLIK
ncbi:MAG: hypothetical protein C5B55_10780 [Blastocatellia bacterium]|nr:MAG: hypothetical protein C5B55_10780 [Blastocatellia bacterium]